MKKKKKEVFECASLMKLIGPYLNASPEVLYATYSQFNEGSYTCTRGPS